jgi:hypothetical protein
MSRNGSPQNDTSCARILDDSFRSFWTFTATTFVASTLLFLVQPMFAKMALPRLGGSPAVWSTCVLFFQAALLLGYLYAHLTTRWLGARRQALLHIVVMASALGSLPLSLGDAAPTETTRPMWWLLTTLTARLGLPFFALSTMAPLVQRWFATLPVPSASNPYFLYAASNTGSMLGLLAYPLLIEPLWGTRMQTVAWAVGYGLLLVLTAICAVRLRRQGHDLPDVRSDGPTSWAQRARWTALALVPSSLMLGVTTHISTDLASIPLLWVLPLAAYLLTFMLVFSTRQWYSRTLVARVLPIVVFAALLSVAFQGQGPWLIPLHLAAFFVTALACHDALSRSRPAARDLTSFYLWMSFGGVLGGVFNTLIAPLLFTGVFEYPIALVLACFTRSSPEYRGGKIEPVARFVTIGAIPALVGAGVWVLGLAPSGIGLATTLLASSIVPAAMTVAANRRMPFNALAAIFVLALIVASGARSERGDVVFADRSFFGVSRVIEATDHSYRLLQHGTTLHGRQNLPAASTCQPKSYYDIRGPVGDLLARSGRRFDDVAAVGLGSGALACYASAGSRWTFFEIDPLVERIARTPSLFTFLANAPAPVSVAIGDGRKLLEATAPASFDLIVLDAFSSDAVPAHLLTREAMNLYMSRLRSGGIVTLHISNRHVNLEPVLGRLAIEQRLAALTNQDLDISAADLQDGRSPTQWVAVAEREAALDVLRAMPAWRPLDVRDGASAWTDDYSNLLRSIRWR